MKRQILLAFAAALAAVIAGGDAYAQAQAPITDPAGRKAQYARQGVKHFPYSAYMANESFDWDITEIVFGENNEVYLRDPIKDRRAGTYIKGKINGTKVVFELPQLIQVVNGVSYYVDRMAYEPGGEYDDPVYVNNDGKHTITYDYDNLSGVFKMEVSGTSRPVGFGLCDVAGQWLQMAESQHILTPFTGTLLTPPANMATEEWGVHHSRGDYAVRIGFYNDQCWIKGISPKVPEGWIGGSVTDNSDGTKNIRIYGNQYIGENSQLNTYAYFMAASTDFFTEYDFYLDSEDYIDLTYDSEAGTIEPGDNAAYVINPGNDYLSISEYYIRFSMSRQSERMPAAPADPEFVEYTQYDVFNGRGLVSFRFSTVDVNGFSLDPQRMVFRFFVDGKPYVFSPDKYGVPAATTDIPYGFYDNNNFSSNQNFHQFFFFEEPMQSIGIQTLYLIGNGYALASNIVEYDVDGIQGIEADEQAESYYDMQGRKVENPVAGLYIKVMRMADGSVKTEKVVK